MIKLNLGCGRVPIKGYTNVDYHFNFGVDEVVDLENIPWPWEDETVEEIVSYRLLEHLENVNDFIFECYRILVPKGKLLVQVPWGIKSLADPQHKRAFLDFSMDRFTGVDSSLDSAKLFLKVGISYIRKNDGFPLYHIKKYIGIGLGRKYEIIFQLVKI